jgi:hypothetical protein
MDPSRSVLKLPLDETRCPVEISVRRIPGIKLIEHVKGILGNLLDRGGKAIRSFFYQYVNAAGRSEDARKIPPCHFVPK